MAKLVIGGSNNYLVGKENHNHKKEKHHATVKKICRRVIFLDFSKSHFWVSYCSPQFLSIIHRQGDDARLSHQIVNTSERCRVY